MAHGAVQGGEITIMLHSPRAERERGERVGEGGGRVRKRENKGDVDGIPI